MSKNKRDSLGLNSLSDSLPAIESNKPDFRELDLGSPVSPLRTRLHANSGAPATSSSSSSSSGSGTRPGQTQAPRRSDSSHSGELSSAHAARSDSSGTSPAPSVLPAGNICPSGKILKPAIASRTQNPHRSDVLGSGTGNYGHGSIMRSPAPALAKCEPVASAATSRGGSGSLAGSISGAEELKRAGNEQYKRGNFSEALGLYDRAISISPGNAAYRSNRAAALTGLGRLCEAVAECEEAVRLDPSYSRAHHRLSNLFLRLGQVENSRKHLCPSPGIHPDPVEFQKLQILERHLNKCTDVRRIGDWRNVLREIDLAIAAGADHCAQLYMCRVEAFLKLHQIDDAESCLSSVSKFEPPSKFCSQIKFFGMRSDAYLHFVRAQYEMALGRFENAVTAAEKAGQIDGRNIEVAVLLSNVRLVTRARARGNDLFKSERFTEACSAYGEGLRFDHSNPVLYCNRAACWFKLGMWEKSIEDCNHALGIQRNYTKALLRRAASNTKLERWADAVRDYEALRKELPFNNEVAESLLHAQGALKKSRGEEDHNLKFGGGVEEVSSIEHFQIAVSLPGVSVIHFKAKTNTQSKLISPFVDTLCIRYPSINFLKVDIEANEAIASSENVRIVPTFKIYKDGIRVNEIVCPSREMLEHSVRHYSL